MPCSKRGVQMTEQEAFKAVCDRRFLDPRTAKEAWDAALDWARTQEEPYTYIYEFHSSVFGIHRAFSPSSWNGLQPSRAIPVFTHPAPAQPVTVVAKNATGETAMGYPIPLHKGDTVKVDQKITFTTDGQGRTPAQPAANTPEALRLADDLDEYADINSAEGGDSDVCETEWKAARELRRLHGESEALKANMSAAQPAVVQQLADALQDFSDYVHIEKSSTDGAIQYSNTQINRLAFKARDALAAWEANK